MLKVHCRTRQGRNGTTPLGGGQTRAHPGPFHQPTQAYRRLRCSQRRSIEFQDQRKEPRQQVPRCDSRNPAHQKIDAILESPSLFLTPQSKPTVEDFVELNEGLKKPRVGFGVAEVATEEVSELIKPVQTASSGHIKQFFGRECEGCRLDGARPMPQRADQP